MDLTVPTIREVIRLLTMCAVLFLGPRLLERFLVLSTAPTTCRGPPMFPPVTMVIVPASRSVPAAQVRLNNMAPRACRLYRLDEHSKLLDLLGSLSLPLRLILNPSTKLHCRLPGTPLFVTTTLMPDDRLRTFVRA